MVLILGDPPREGFDPRMPHPEDFDPRGPRPDGFDRRGRGPGPDFFPPRREFGPRGMMGPRMGMGPDGFGPRPLLRGPGEYLLFCCLILTLCQSHLRTLS